MTATYRYRAGLVRVIDGDTYELDVDLGFYVHRILTVRLQGVDTYELREPGGLAAMAFAEAVLSNPRASIVVASYKDRQSFARWVCDVWVEGMPMAQLLRENGHVKGSRDVRVS